MANFYATSFSDQTPEEFSHVSFGTDWPVVYIIDDGHEAYVGETLDASVRASQHLHNPDRRRLTRINLITDGDYNKSVILDLEAFLIKHMSADDRFTLQNGNAGLHMHNYYRRADYQMKFDDIWAELIQRNLAQKTLREIENSDLFKYSPYNSLSTDQYAAVSNILGDMTEAMLRGEDMTAIVEGGPGTGKTILAVYMMKLLAEHPMKLPEVEAEADSENYDLYENLKKLPSGMRIGLVIPMQSLRTTLTGVFKSIAGLKNVRVLKPSDVPELDGKYDLLVVDEAHRLQRRHALAHYPSFDAGNKRLNLDEHGTELDWIRLKSKYQVLFYDRNQTVRPSDIPASYFRQLYEQSSTKIYHLRTQFRCMAGDAYIAYIRSIFSDCPPTEMQQFDQYDFRLFTDCGEMTDRIKELNDQYSLCRTVAGYSWEWVSNKHPEKYDIELDGRSYKWNTTSVDWVNSENAVNEIGCIHTIQGYDLNYAAVIIGKEIDYDPVCRKLTVDKNQYHDTRGKAVGNGGIDLLRDQILNVYSTMLTRGIRGTYVYVCNPNLRKYLQKYIPLQETEDYKIVPIYQTIAKIAEENQTSEFDSRKD